MVELKVYLRILLDKGWIVLPTFAITFVASLLLTSTQTPVYEAKATYVVRLSIASQDDRTLLSGLATLGSSGILGTLVEVANSRLIEHQAADQLGLTSAQIRDLSVNSRPILGTNMIEILVQGSDPSLARDFSAAVGEKTATRVRQLYDVYEMQLIDEPTKPSRPVRPNQFLNAILGAVIGLILGASLAFLAHYLQSPLETRGWSPPGKEDRHQGSLAGGSFAALGEHQSAPALPRSAQRMPGQTLAPELIRASADDGTAGAEVRNGRLAAVSGGATGGPLPTAAPWTAASLGIQSAPLGATSLRTVLDERFADNRLGWLNKPTATTGLGKGGYRLSGRTSVGGVAVGAPLAQTFRDVVVQGRFRKVGGPPGSGYGIIVRDEGPGPRNGVNQGGRFYLFEVSDAGEFGIWRREQDRWVDIVPWTLHAAIQKDREPNELIVRALGPWLTLIVNGTEVASVEDTVLRQGGIGLYSGGDLNEVVIDRFVVQVPE